MNKEERTRTYVKADHVHVQKQGSETVVLQIKESQPKLLYTNSAALVQPYFEGQKKKTFEHKLKAEL